MQNRLQIVPQHGARCAYRLVVAVENHLRRRFETCSVKQQWRPWPHARVTCVPASVSGQAASVPPSRPTTRRASDSYV